MSECRSSRKFRPPGFLHEFNQLGFTRTREIRSVTMHVLGKFPRRRMRRLRHDDFSRRLVREHRLSADDLIYPVFVIDGQNRSEAVPSMPGVERMSVDRLLKQAERCVELKIPAIALCPVVDNRFRTTDAREAFNPEGLAPRAIRELKTRFPELAVITDITVDPSPSNG